MSKMGKSKTSLLTEFFYYDSENLSSQIKLQKIFLLLKKCVFILRINKKKPQIYYILRYFKKNIIKFLII
jgi:hypothetical protein